jgi:hypothetical protein
MRYQISDSEFGGNENAFAGSCKLERQRAAARARSDDYDVVIAHCIFLRLIIFLPLLFR